MKFFTLTALSLLVTIAHAQTLLYNEAMIKVQPGAVLYVEGNIQNTSMGTIDNDGTIELKGNFVNAGMWEPSQVNTLRFSGDAHSDVTAGSAVFQNVQIQKGNTFNVNLLSNVTVNNALDFNGTNNKINLGAFNLNMGPIATTTGHDSDEFVVTGSTGVMKKDFASFTSYEYPVGFDAATYNPATLNVTAGPNDTYSVRVGASPTNGDGLTGTALTTDVVNAVWSIQETTPLGNTANLTLGWQDTDELPGFNPALNAVSWNDGTNGWDGLFANLGPEVSNTRTRNGLTGFGAFAVGDETIGNTLLVDAKVFLEGPFASGSMGDGLRVGNMIPTTEPYAGNTWNLNYVHTAYGGGETVSSTAVFDQPADGNDIVDWIVVELRNSSTPTQIVASKAGLVQRDGNIVDLDGISQLAIQGVADGNYYIGLRHRNHLGVRSNITYSLSNAPQAMVVDFTLAGIAFDDGTVIKPVTPMKVLTGGALGLWAGDANFNGFVLYNGGGNDRSIVLGVVGLSTPGNSVPGYNRADLNMNGFTLYNGGGNDRNVILTNVGLSTPGDVLTAHNNN